MIDLVRYKTKNAKALLKNLYFSHSVTRGKLAKIQNCTPAMISIISGKMLQDNIIKEAPSIETIVKTGPKEKTLVFNGDFAYILGVYVGRGRVSVGVANARNKPVLFVNEFFDDLDRENRVAFIEKKGREFLKKFGKANFLGCGIGLVGLSDDGEFSKLKAFDESFDVKAHFENVFSLPVVVENNVKALAVAEYLDGSKKQDDRFIFVKYGPGLGSAMVSTTLSKENDIYCGEIGHTKVAGSVLPCACGKKGCLEAEIREEHILSLYNDKAKRKLSKIDELYALADKGDEKALEAASYFIDKLALTLANLFIIFKNLKIVLCGKAFSVRTIKKLIFEKTAAALETKSVEDRLSVSSLENDERFLGGSAIALWNILLD